MATEFRILDQNEAFRTANGLSSTSEDANFPATNLSSVFRSRVWRSSGYFEITASNNKIDFDEGGGALVATIPVGNYSTSLLATTIEALLEASGTFNYTVSFSSSTGKWTIAGSSNFSLLWFTGANSGSSIGATIGYDVSADNTSSNTYTSPDIALHTVERFIIDLKSTNEPIDSFCLFFPEDGSKFTQNATLKLKANATNAGWDTASVDETITIDSNLDAAAHFFATDQAYRYWAVEVVDASNPNIYIELGTVSLAKATQVQGPEIGFTWENEDTSNIDQTDFGQRYADLLPNTRLAKYTFKVITLADRNTLEDIYNRIGKVIPVAISLDSTETLYDKERFLLYGTVEEKAAFKHVVRDLFDFALTHEEKF